MGGSATSGAEPSWPRRTTTGWVVGRAVASVALLVLAVLAGCSDDGSEPSTRQRELGPVDDLCDAVDFTPVFEVHAFMAATVEERTESSTVDETGSTRATSAVYQTSCILDDSTGRGTQDAGPRGSMVASVVIYDTAEIARQIYDGLGEAQVDRDDGPAGRWDDSRASGQETSYGSEATLAVLDDVLIMNLRLAISSWSTPPDLKVQEAALAQLAENMSDVLRR